MKKTSTAKILSKLAIVVAAMAITLPLEARRGGGGTCMDGGGTGTRQMQGNRAQDGSGSGQAYARGDGTGARKHDGNGLGQGSTQGKRQGSADGSGMHHKGANANTPTTDGGE